MQLKPTAVASVPTQSIQCGTGDFDLTGPTVAWVAPVLPLSLDDLVTALMLGYCTTAEVAEMTDDEIRREVGFTLGVNGIMTVHNAVDRDRDPRLADFSEVALQHRRVCEARVIAAFGLARASRPRAAARSIGARRELVKAA
jgi:hypothetical protein